jgi:hypothetical protein
MQLSGCLQAGFFSQDSSFAFGDLKGAVKQRTDCHSSVGLVALHPPQWF